MMAAGIYDEFFGSTEKARTAGWSLLSKLQETGEILERWADSQIVVPVTCGCKQAERARPTVISDADVEVTTNRLAGTVASASAPTAAEVNIGKEFVQDSSRSEASTAASTHSAHSDKDSVAREQLRPNFNDSDPTSSSKAAAVKVSTPSAATETSASFYNFYAEAMEPLRPPASTIASSAVVSTPVPTPPWAAFNVPVRSQAKVTAPRTSVADALEEVQPSTLRGIDKGFDSTSVDAAPERMPRTEQAQASVETGQPIFASAVEASTVLKNPSSGPCAALRQAAEARKAAQVTPESTTIPQVFEPAVESPVGEKHDFDGSIRDIPQQFGEANKGQASKSCVNVMNSASTNAAPLGSVMQHGSLVSEASQLELAREAADDVVADLPKQINMEKRCRKAGSKSCISGMNSTSTAGALLGSVMQQRRVVLEAPQPEIAREEADDVVADLPKQLGVEKKSRKNATKSCISGMNSTSTAGALLGSVMQQRRAVLEVPQADVGREETWDVLTDLPKQVDVQKKSRKAGSKSCISGMNSSSSTAALLGSVMQKHRVVSDAA